MNLVLVRYQINSQNDSSLDLETKEHVTIIAKHKEIYVHERFKHFCCLSIVSFIKYYCLACRKPYIYGPEVLFKHAIFKVKAINSCSSNTIVTRKVGVHYFSYADVIKPRWFAGRILHRTTWNSDIFAFRLRDKQNRQQLNTKSKLLPNRSFPFVLCGCFSFLSTSWYQQQISITLIMILY